MKISVKNISKTFGKKNNRFEALKNVSFEIPDGASVAIIGKSGSGKSTNFAQRKWDLFFRAFLFREMKLALKM